MRALLCVLIVSCTSAPPPIFIPEPLTDADPYSALARAVRARDAPRIRSAIDTIRAQPPPAEALPHLEALEARASDPYIDPRPASRVVALGLRSTRTTFYVLYGWLHDWEIERERPFVRALAATLRSRGYAVVVDEDTTPDEWYDYVSNRDMAGVLWRSEGWFEHKPSTPPSHITTRVWTTILGFPKHRIFSDDWASTLPEGLSFADIASCGSSGPFLEDEVDALHDLPDPSTLTFHTFDTALLDRTLYLRTHRGLLATSGYTFDDLSWTLATTLPPDRSDLDPSLSTTGRQEMIDLLSDPGHPPGLERTMASDPLTWIPLLIDAFPATASTLNHLSSTFTGTPESFPSRSEWASWWDSLTTLRNDALHIREHAPTEADVWIALTTTFTSATAHYRGTPYTGIDLEGFCWERFLRCTFSDLSPWQRSSDLLTRTATTFCSTPLPTPLTVTHDPSTSTLSHDLEDVLAATSSTTVLDACTSLD